MFVNRRVFVDFVRIVKTKVGKLFTIEKFYRWVIPFVWLVVRHKFRLVWPLNNEKEQKIHGK